MWLRHLLTWVQQPSQIWPPALFPCPIGTILLQSMGGAVKVDVVVQVVVVVKVGCRWRRWCRRRAGGEHFTCEHLRRNLRIAQDESSTSDVSAIFLPLENLLRTLTRCCSMHAYRVPIRVQSRANGSYFIPPCPCNVRM